MFLFTLILIDGFFDSRKVRLHLVAQLRQLFISLRETRDLGRLVKAALPPDDDSSGHGIDFNDQTRSHTAAILRIYCLLIISCFRR